MSHVLPKLPYAFNALEPHIDAQTMEIHYSKHHQAYVNNLNTALAGTGLEDTAPEALIGDLAKVPDAKRTSVRNNGGGHVNHSMFWEVMKPGGSKSPSGALATALDSTFGGVLIRNRF